MTDPDDLAGIAVELVTRVRDEHPQTNGGWLAKALPDPDDWWRLIWVLAAAVPADQPWTELTAWAHDFDQQPPILLPVKVQPGEVQPCGTVAAERRHRYHGEPVCDLCREAVRAHDRARKRVRRVVA